MGTEGVQRLACESVACTIMLFDTSQVHAHNDREGVHDVWLRDAELSP